MSYTEYIDIISQAKWMITFGEGLDYYFLESARSGSIPFAVYNNVFFDESFAVLPTVYDDNSIMYKNIVSDIKTLDNRDKYEALNNRIIKIDNKQYNDKEYKENVEKYYLGQFTYPIEKVKAERRKRLNDKPLISIIMATYNGEKYISEQIESLLMQDYSNFEIIISDCGSTDSTIEIIKDYISNNHDLIRIFRNEKSKYNDSISNCIEKSRGEYIALCNQDDIWLNNKLSRLLERIDEFDIIHSSVSIIDKDENFDIFSKYYWELEEDKTNLFQLENYIFKEPILGCTSLIRKDSILAAIPIKEEVMFHDCWFAMHCIKYGKGIVFLDEQLVKYRLNKNQFSRLEYYKNDFYDEKLRYDKYLLNKWNNDLNSKEITYIQNDINKCNIYNLLKKYTPLKLDDFIINNSNKFSNTLMQEMKNLLEKMENDE